MTHSLLTLADRWRSQASDLRRWGAESQAVVLVMAADELEAYMNEEISPAQAAEEAPHIAESTIRNRLSSGALENYGKPGSPLVRRGDLYGIPRRSLSAVDPAVRRKVAGGR